MGYNLVEAEGVGRTTKGGLLEMSIWRCVLSGQDWTETPAWLHWTSVNGCARLDIVQLQMWRRFRLIEL